MEGLTCAQLMCMCVHLIRQWSMHEPLQVQQYSVLNEGVFLKYMTIIFDFYMRLSYVHEKTHLSPFEANHLIEAVEIIAAEPSMLLLRVSVESFEDTQHLPLGCVCVVCVCVWV